MATELLKRVLQHNKVSILESIFTFVDKNNNDSRKVNYPMLKHVALYLIVEQYFIIEIPVLIL